MNQVILWHNAAKECLAQLARLLRWQDKQIGEKGDISPGNSTRKCEYLAILLRYIQRSCLEDVMQIRWNIAWQR
jgi:hypothetical protein